MELVVVFIRIHPCVCTLFTCLKVGTVYTYVSSTMSDVIIVAVAAAVVVVVVVEEEEEEEEEIKHNSTTLKLKFKLTVS